MRAKFGTRGSRAPCSPPARRAARARCSRPRRGPGPSARTSSRTLARRVVAAPFLWRIPAFVRRARQRVGKGPTRPDRRASESSASEPAAGTIVAPCRPGVRLGHGGLMNWVTANRASQPGVRSYPPPGAASASPEHHPGRRLADRCRRYPRRQRGGGDPVAYRRRWPRVPGRVHRRRGVGQPPQLQHVAAG